MQTQQKRWLTDLMEGVPSIVFILLWRQSGDLEFVGWVGSALCLMVLGALIGMKVRMHPILMGVNIHILLATPLILGLFRLGFDGVGDVLAEYAYGGVLVTVFAVGFAQMLFSRSRFAALENVTDRVQLVFSAVLLAFCACGAVWALLTPGSRFVPVVVTIAALIMGRNFLQARLSDKSAGAGVLVTGSAAAPGTSQDVQV
jgi:hypothetical protein